MPIENENSVIRTLLIQCQDQPGLIHFITSVLYAQNANITSNREFVDRESSAFFMRTEFTGGNSDESIIHDLSNALPKNALIKIPSAKKKKLILLVTKESHALGDLLLRHEAEELNAEIVKVISNHDALRLLTEKFLIPFEYIPHEGINREEHEKRILAAIFPQKPDFIVLAKYMRILTLNFVQNFPDRIINIHHSFLPAFIGSKPYHQAHQRGVKIIGATAHFVTQNLDEGPIIAQNVIPVNHADSPEDMIQSGRDIEKTVLARALKLALEDRIFTHKNRTILFD